MRTFLKIGLPIALATAVYFNIDGSNAIWAGMLILVAGLCVGSLFGKKKPTA
ncbi:MAG: hypothetical protein Q7K54_03775 [Candidatus Parcubacteria bacterium]|nr:hypothetical protein [Candidatus Parcubacteria bacterium]